MTDQPGRWHPFGRTRKEDLEILTNGGETGWWDDTGRPAPWPQDFLDPEAGRTTAVPGPDPALTGPRKPPF